MNQSSNNKSPQSVTFSVIAFYFIKFNLILGPEWGKGEEGGGGVVLRRLTGWKGRLHAKY